MPNLDPNYVRNALCRIARARIKVFGAEQHRFTLQPPLPESDAAAFEQRHDIRLPVDYRHFITQIGNGGAGPDYGLFPLGYTDAIGTQLKPWSEDDGFVGILSQPFPFDKPWNDKSEEPKFALEENEEEYEKQMDAFEAKYWSSSLMNGAFPICHRGCALRLWLVVTGKESGNVWFDGRADYSGLSPVLLKNGSRAAFSSWYSEWLEDALARC
jgi:SMI1 / KNR4 family (SUKH-1)